MFASVSSKFSSRKMIQDKPQPGAVLANAIRDIFWPACAPPNGLSVGDGRHWRLCLRLMLLPGMSCVYLSLWRVCSAGLGLILTHDIVISFHGVSPRLATVSSGVEGTETRPGEGGGYSSPRGCASPCFRLLPCDRSDVTTSLSVISSCFLMLLSVVALREPSLI